VGGAENARSWRRTRSQTKVWQRLELELDAMRHLNGSLLRARNIRSGSLLRDQRSVFRFPYVASQVLPPIKHKKQTRGAPSTIADLEPAELVQGCEYPKGEFLLVGVRPRGKWPSSAPVDRDRRFVKLEEVDPVYLRSHLLPVRRFVRCRGGAYFLLLRAMLSTGYGGLSASLPLCQFNLFLILSHCTLSRMEPALFPPRRARQNEIEEAVFSDQGSESELQLAEQVIAEPSRRWNIADFENEYRLDLRRCSKRSSRGGIKRPRRGGNAGAST